jgi:aminoglycoside phosphotransferase (APT) family kinase protein
MSLIPDEAELVSPATAGAVLADLGLVAAGTPVRARALSGGISNVVLAVSWAGGRAVLKQSLPRLRVATEWTFDRGRIRNERRCMELLGELLPAGAVPSVLAHDDERFLFVMSHAPRGGRVWKDELLAGRIDLPTARRAGELLGAIHGRTAGDPHVAEAFADQTPLIQGRVDPYHRTAAARNPDVAGVVLAEVDRLLATRTALVLGDWSPKNLLAYPDRVLALDFEVAHLGDPAFDVAFLLTHLVLKGVHRPQDRPALRAAAAAFVDAYMSVAGPAAPDDGAVVAELGCLLLARVDGKSPAEYLTGEIATGRVRAMARDLLLGGGRNLNPVLDHLLS